jgi:molybdopterin synthase catalytic subunit
MVLVTHDPIDPSRAYDLIRRDVSGSVLLHYAVVKSDIGNDKPTTCIDYRSCGDTEGEMAGIAADLRKKWDLEDMLIIRRTGCLGVGEIISLVAASSANSEDAFNACKAGITSLKKMSTIQKQERFD